MKVIYSTNFNCLVLAFHHYWITFSLFVVDYTQSSDSTCWWQWGIPIPTSSQHWKGTTTWWWWLLYNVSTLEIVDMSNSSVHFRVVHEIHFSILQHLIQRMLATWESCYKHSSLHMYVWVGICWSQVCMLSFCFPLLNCVFFT